MRPSLIFTTLGIFGCVVAEQVTCKPNEKFIRLPTEANRDFAAAMIVSMYKNASDSKPNVPPSRTLRRLNSAKFYGRSPSADPEISPVTTGSIIEACHDQSCVASTSVSSIYQTSPDLMEFGGLYPANHRIWRQVHPQLLSEYSTWCEAVVQPDITEEFRDNANTQMRRLCNLALDTIINEHLQYAQLALAGQTTTTAGSPEWRHLLAVAQQFAPRIPEFFGIMRDLQNTMDRVADNIPVPPAPHPSPGPDITTPIRRPLTRWLDRNCAWAPRCRPNSVGEVLRCVGRCGLDTIDNEYHPNPRAESSRITALTLWGITGVFIIFTAILLGNISTLKHYQGGKRDDGDNFLFTNVRIEFPRGGAPRDVRRIDPNAKPSLDILSIMEDGLKPPPGWNQEYDDGKPAKRYEKLESTNRINSRDDQEDRSCIPGSVNDLEKVIFNLWLTQFRPAVRAGEATTMQFSAFDDERGGPYQILNGGQFVVKMWATKMPDWAGLKNPNIDNYVADSYDFEDMSIKSLKDAGSTNGIECFTETRPYGSINDVSAARPRKDWHSSVTDACYASWGKGGVSGIPTKGFTYQGRGKNSDKDFFTDGYGWGFRYRGQDSCKRRLKCQDFTGSRFDAIDHGGGSGGDLDNLYETCTQKSVNADGLFRGGRMDHRGPHPSKWGKRDDEACGVLEIWPLLDEFEVQTNADGSDKVIEAPDTGHVSSF